MWSSRCRSARPGPARPLLLSARRRLAGVTPHRCADRSPGRLPCSRGAASRRTRAALARLHPPSELRAIALGHDLLQPGQHLTLLLAHVVPHAFFECVDAGVDLAVLVARRPQLGDELLQARVLAQRFPDETAELGIHSRTRGGIDDLLLEPGVQVELTTDALDRRA